MIRRFVSEVRVTRVYVDDAALPFRGHVMYHMFSPNIEALHGMADLIGMPRRYFQNPATMPGVRWPHYDISHELRVQAVRLGVVEVDRFQLVAMSGIILGKADPLELFRGNRFREQCVRLTDWLREEGFSVEG